MLCIVIFEVKLTFEMLTRTVFIFDTRMDVLVKVLKFFRQTYLNVLYRYRYLDVIDIVSGSYVVWKCPKGVHGFRFARISIIYIQRHPRSQHNKSNDYILVMDVVYRRNHSRILLSKCHECNKLLKLSSSVAW